MSNEKKSTPTIQNRKAFHDYNIEETYEAGIVLQGTEVKSLREGKANFTDAFAYIQNQEVWLRDFHISPYKFGSYTNHDPRRQRKLLLNKREIRELDKYVQQKGYTLVPLKLYFKNGYAKIQLGVAKGKKSHDKRSTIKEKDTRREIERHVKGTAKINL